MPHGPSKDKMQCPHCACGQSFVQTVTTRKVTWYGRTKTIIKRYRVCRYCKLPFTTIETLEDDNNPNQPEPVIPQTALDQKKAELAQSSYDLGFQAAMEQIAAQQANKRQPRKR